MSLFITVGSTGFDQLIETTTATEFLSSLKALGITKVTYQYGSSESIFNKNMQAYNGPVIDMNGYKYKPNIEEDMKKADIIISHAGAGTILQALRLKNKKLIVVVNMTLMDNHQYELASAMEKRNYAICSEPSNLMNTLQNIKKATLTPFPDPNSELFAGVVNEQMGFY
ncbi:glycosyltransferase family 1 protein [Backusella circina FSU 941]|nr:glycosyltransferase family 1 protein [Backusella circina FSU 941]